MKKENEEKRGEKKSEKTSALNATKEQPSAKQPSVGTRYGLKAKVGDDSLSMTICSVVVHTHTHAHAHVCAF